MEEFLVEIATDATGRNVYIIDREGIDDIKTFVSSDFGVTWTDTTGSFADGTEPQIATNSTGIYVYIIWENGLVKIKIFYSSNFGDNWTDADPTEIIFGNGEDSHIVTDDSGRYVYATWVVTSPGAIKVFVSSDFGATWTDAGVFGTGVIPFIKYKF